MNVYEHLYFPEDAIQVEVFFFIVFVRSFVF